MGSVGSPRTPAGVPTLAIEGLSVAYPTSTGPFRAVRDASFSIAPGERIALVGESGSGKSSMALAIGGFLTQPGIEVTTSRFDIEGEPVVREHGGRLPRKTPGLAMIFQDAMTSLDPVYTVGSQLSAVIRGNDRVSKKDAADRSRYWLTRTGLTDTARVMAARPYELSGGMRQRVMMALALCSQPRILIADEPTSALDASLAREAMELLVQLTDEFDTSLLIVSHDIRLCQQYTDRILIMYRGQIVEQGVSATLAYEATHPYTRGLLACIPTLDTFDLDELPTLATVSPELFLETSR
jgi:ABC-type dipeptide/oligopeptide/nickel transport system ATPase component